MISPEKKQKIIKETKAIALIVILVFAFRSTFFEPFRIPSGSMIPTLMIGDFILVNKFSYGFKLPYSDMFGDPIYLTSFDGPKRGDVVVFKYPRDTSFNYIKRIVGLPGDTVEVINKKLFINSKPIEEKEFDGKKIMDDMDDKFKEYKFHFYDVKTGEHKHVIQEAEGNFGLPSSFGPVIVPSDHYFAMGDNRDFSADGRVWGFIPKGHIKGKALFVWFSWIIPFLDDHPTRIRPWRIGTLINK